MMWMGDVMSRDEDGRKTPEVCLVRGAYPSTWQVPPNPLQSAGSQPGKYTLDVRHLSRPGEKKCIETRTTGPAERSRSVSTKGNKSPELVERVPIQARARHLISSERLRQELGSINATKTSRATTAPSDHRVKTTTMPLLESHLEQIALSSTAIAELPFVLVP